MRNSKIIENIKKNFSDPYVVKNFINDQDLNYLISLFETSSDINKPYVYKNTGPVTLDLKHFDNDKVVNDIYNRLRIQIGPFIITSGFFFQTNYPHILHNDDTYELPDNVYKGITLPLHLENFTGLYPKLCFFDQFYFHGPAKFFKGDSGIPTYYNKQIYEYSNVDGLVDNFSIDQNHYFTHLKPQWLEGLSLHSTLDWIPGDALIFDSVRLHCASDFRNLGIQAKLGISIFTLKK